MLVEAFATSRLMFGAVVWGHIFGPRLQLRRPGCTAAARIEVAHRRHLRWALNIPIDVRTGFMHVLTNQLPFQGLVVKQQVRYFGKLESQLPPGVAQPEP